MAKVSERSYSRYSREALVLFGRLVAAARRERQMTAQELAERAGISRGLLQRIEKGDPGCQIGAAFEVAAIVGIRLFDVEPAALAGQIRETSEKLALLPKSVRTRGMEVDDDF